MNFETIPKKDAFGKFECGYPKVTTENLPNTDFSERPKGMARLLAVPSHKLLTRILHEKGDELSKDFENQRVAECLSRERLHAICG